MHLYYSSSFYAAQEKITIIIIHFIIYNYQYIDADHYGDLNDSRGAIFPTRRLWLISCSETKAASLTSEK